MIDQPEKTENPQSVTDWVITLLITYIPLVNIIMLLIWAFDSETPLSKKNWAKARLIWVLIGIAISTIFFTIFGAAMLASGVFDAANY
ncbi:hypothetical protein O3Q51_02750 [Cryomorphaceae bacterium 1068]|nr:hypothetical protein [Cryomorphaceae bacterium 1068]